MPWGSIQKIFSDEYEFRDIVIIESPFFETNRIGKIQQSVQLALTPTVLVMASKSKLYEDIGSYGSNISTSQDRLLELCSLYPLTSVKLSVFKRSQRQSLKARFKNDRTRYFELGALKNKKIFWKLWCLHLDELHNENKCLLSDTTCTPLEDCSRHEEIIFDISVALDQQSKKKWTDKDLYLGVNRSVEDRRRPVPIPGLGSTDESKLSYIKPSCNCWDLADNWIQRHNSEGGTGTFYEYDDVYTYTGEPTSNVTYTSLMTTVCTIVLLILSFLIEYFLLLHSLQ